MYVCIYRYICIHILLYVYMYTHIINIMSPSAAERGVFTGWRIL